MPEDIHSKTAIWNHNAATTWFAGCPKGSPGLPYTPCWPAGINENVKDQYITLYPNPASNELNIESSLALDEVVIYDNIGRMLSKSNLKSNKIDISGLPNGVYHLQCSGEGHIYNVKFVKAQ